MNRRWSILVVVPLLAGCSGDGPREFFRSSLQARSEFVDSLSEIVDEPTASTKFKIASGLYKERQKKVEEDLSAFKRITDPLFNRVNRGNFAPDHISPPDTEMLIDMMKAYLEYDASIVPTDVRMSREAVRMRRLARLMLLDKARRQLETKQPIDVEMSRDTPNLYNVVSFYVNDGRLARPQMRVLPGTILEKSLLKLYGALTQHDLNRLFGKPEEGRQEAKPFQPPPLPPYPAWAIEVDRASRLHLTNDKIEDFNNEGIMKAEKLIK